MGLLGRIKDEKRQLKTDLENMQGTLQRLKAYGKQAIDVIDAINLQLKGHIAKPNLHEDLKTKLREAMSSLAYAKEMGSKLQGAANRETLLDTVKGHYRKAAASLGSAASML